MPHAPCPMPHAPCPMPHAPCPMPHAPGDGGPTLPGGNGRAPKAVCHWAGDRAKLRTEVNFDRREPSNFLEEIVSPRSGSSPLFLLH